MAARAGSVLMLVYIDVASLVKRMALDGRVPSAMRRSFSTKESLKYDGWARAIGRSISEIHFPNPCGRLLTSEHTGRVGHRPSFIPLCILYRT